MLTTRSLGCVWSALVLLCTCAQQCCVVPSSGEVPAVDHLGPRELDTNDDSFTSHPLHQNKSWPAELPSTTEAVAQDSLTNLSKRAPIARYQPFQVGPWFNDFPDMWTVNAVVNMFGESLMLANAALAAMSNVQLDVAPQNLETYTFMRYFHATEFHDVQCNFRRLLGPGPSYTGPQALPSLEVYFRNRPGAFWIPNNPPFSCDNVPNLNGEMEVDPVSGRASMLLCPYLFADPKPVSLIRAMDNHCGFIGASADLNMDVPAGTIIHELLHWFHQVGYASNGPYGGRIVDWNSRGDPNRYNPNAYPADGYGPFNAWQVNAHNGAGSYNADSYKWFALESFFSQKCPQTGAEGHKQPRFFTDPTPGWFNIPVYPDFFLTS